MPESWSPDWSNAVFSLEERDRRWGRVRGLMRQHGIDLVVCLPWTGSHDRAQADPRYLTQLGENSDETIVAFPVEGEVTAWHTRPGVWPGSNWISDIRAAPRGTGGRTISTYLSDLPELQRATIGIAALDASFLAHVRAAEGEVNWQSVDIIKREHPNARFVSATPVLGQARWRKSEEEVQFLKKGTEIAEKTVGAILAHARAGVAERDVFAEMYFVNADEGGSFQPMFGWISGPLGNTYHRVEQPSLRKLQVGDVISAEIEGRWGGYIAQIDRTFSAGPAHQDLKDGFKLACESFDRVFETLKPGVTVGQLAAAADIKGMGGRGHATLTMHGRGTGDDGPGWFGTPTTTGTPAGGMADVVIEEGCCFILKPGTAVDGKPDYGRWGESVVVRASGAERLGSTPQILYELG